MSEKKNLFEKLLAIQRSVENFTKDKKGFNYEYTTGSQVLGVIRPLMNDLGLILKQEVLSITNERIDYLSGKESKPKSEMFTSTIQLFTWIDSATGEREECRWAANGQNDWDKGLGSALTYGERYFLLKFFHVPTDGDDPDTRQGENAHHNQSNQGQQKTEDNRPWITEAALNTIIDRYNKGEIEVKEKTIAHFRMKKEYRAKLDALK
jgi:hypothetical protein